MDRRRFLRNASVGATMCVVGPVGCSMRSESSITGESKIGRPTPFELDEATILSLQEGMKAGRYTARSITELYLKRIDALDRQGPNLRSIIEINPDALNVANDLDI